MTHSSVLKRVLKKERREETRKGRKIFGREEESKKDKTLAKLRAYNTP